MGDRTRLYPPCRQRVSERLLIPWIHRCSVPSCVNSSRSSCDLKMEARSNPSSDQGPFAGTVTRYHRFDSLRRQPAYHQQVRGLTAVTEFPYGSFLRCQAASPHSGSRAFHGSRIASESSKGSSANRPLSPHLALKKPQLAATYSISHRIFGASVASLILLSPVLMKYSLMFDV